VRPAGNCHVLQGTDGLFFGVDHLQVVNAVLAADLSHDPGQGAHAGLVDIRNLKGRGLHLIARAHGADHRNARRTGPKNDLLFAGNGVDGIHHIVILGKIELVGGVRHEKGLVSRHLAVGIDVQNAVPGHIHLVFCNGAAGGQNLPVQVGDADLVVIDQIQRPNPGPGQGLHGISPHAADAKHGNPGVFQPLHGILAKDQLRSGKLIQHSSSISLFCSVRSLS